MLTSPRQLAYAPTPHSYVPNPTLSATINLDEVKPLTLASFLVSLDLTLDLR